MTFLCPAAGSRLSKPLIRLLMAAVLLLAGSVFLYGGGGRDEVLASADTLIENKQYDNAIQVLSSYMKTNPDKFEEAQERLQRIVKIREQYNVIADELLDVLRDYPEDNERILALTEALNAIEPTSNPSAERFLEQVTALAVFNRNRNRLEAVLADGRALLEAGDYTGAMAAYTGGLDMYQEEFFNSGYGEDTENLAREGLANIARAASDFSALVTPFDRAAGSLRDSGGIDLDAFRELYSGFSGNMEELAALRNEIRETGLSYDARQEILRREHESLGDRSFLAFASRLIHGPAGENEGMLGVLDRYWEGRVSLAEAAVFAEADSLYNQGYAAAENREYSRSVSLLERAAEYIAISLDFINRRYAYEEPEDPPVNLLFDDRVLAAKTEDYLKYRFMGIAASAVRDTELLGERFDRLLEEGFPALALWQEGRMEGPEAAAAEDQIRGSFAALAEELALVRTPFNDRRASIENYRDSGEDSPAGFDNALRIMNDAGDVIDAMDAGIGEQILNSAVRRYTIANGDLEKEVTAREEEFEKADSLIQGIPQTLEEGVEYTAHYPSEGLAILTDLSRSVSVNLTAGRELLSGYNGESGSLLEAPALASLYASAREMVNRLTGLQSRSGTLAAAARTRISQAGALRSEGDRLFRESQAAMTRNDFDLARERLDQATNRYHDSLAIQESASLRATWDTQLVNLGAEIADRLNEIVVRDVRTLVNNAKNSYYAGDFGQADNLLSRAQSRWRTTNSTENSEVSYWINLVRGALSLQAGKDIPVTAPLYAEMSQLLSDARRNFDEGTRMINSGRRQAGLARFAEALQKTRELRLIFPMNQEARLLELRMEQVTDPPAFERTFRDRINEAVAGTKPVVRSPESFATLEELAIINPRYPNIDRIIRQAKIDMGYLPPDPDPRAIARSSELTGLARSIIDAQNSVQYQVALAQLDEAIRLNPNNAAAVIAKDMLLTRMTGTGIIVLDSNSKDLYDQAVLQLQQRNYINALAIVQQLLQNPKNRNSTQILDLQRRIESLL